MSAKQSLKHGKRFPYHNRPPIDWAEEAALGVLANLSDRRTIKWALEDVEASEEEDDCTRCEIVRSLADIIRTAAGKSASEVTK